MECQDGDKKDVRRPMNAFLIFCKRHRSMVREKNPDLDNRSVTRILGDLWANLAEEKKSVYTTLAKQYKDAFMKANPDYKWHNPDKIHQPPAKMATRPTNARVIKNELDINLEGSIVPGKLADPAKMGGLSLLLMAGQQSNLPGKTEGLIRERHNSETLSSPSDDHPGSSKSALLELAEMCTSELEQDPDEAEHQTKNIQKTTQPPLDPKIVLSPSPVPDYSFPHQYSDSEPMDLSIKNTKHDSPKSQTKQDGREEPLIKQEKLPMEVKHTLVELMKTPRDIIPMEGKYADDIKPVVKEEKMKTEESQKESANVGGNSDQNDNDIVNCGKMVVDHIIDKLLTAQSDGQQQNTAGVPENQTVVNSAADDNTQEVQNVLETQNPRRMSEGQLDDFQDTEKDGGLKHHLDSESQENDDLVPVRKSRRRNRGQRYQALINEGIIQPSKERLAARKAAKTHPDEELEDYDDYAVVEDVVEKKPSRKRMISEGEDGEDLKKYKTGDFDLEAHIADLPACSLEQLSKGKKNAARTRHLSESSIKKQPTPLATKEESTTCLPPHVKLKTSEQPPPENIVGSRRRKFRKHSITHLIPAKSVTGTSVPNKADLPSPAKALVPEKRGVRCQSLEVKGQSYESKSTLNITEVKCDESNKMNCQPSSQLFDISIGKMPQSESSTEKSDNDEVPSVKMDSSVTLGTEEYSENEKIKSDLPIDIFEGQSLDNGPVHSESSVEKTKTEDCADLNLGLDDKDTSARPSSLFTETLCNKPDAPVAIVTDPSEPIPSNMDNVEKVNISRPTFNHDLNSDNCSQISEAIFETDESRDKSDISEKNSDAIKMDWSDEDKSDKTLELLPLKEADVESTISAPAALRMEILATELKSEEPSIQCQGSPPVAAVHS